MRVEGPKCNCCKSVNFLYERTDAARETNTLLRQVWGNALMRAKTQGKGKGISAGSGES